MLIVGGRGNYTVMTGDGVDDAPPLKFTPVGIATGMEGSDVTKDVVLAGAHLRLNPCQRKGCVSPLDRLPSGRTTRRSAIGV
jgi:magnesium-transporting ATPase (P-type)